MIPPNTLLQNRYLILEQIGEGGMGAVYLAQDQRLRSNVALKETSVSDASLLQAFEHEAHLLASLRHPALPKVIDHFVESNGQYLVMEFIPGEDFGERLERTGTALSPREVLRWADQLLDALDYLHSNQPPIIHRDIKPQNLKITNRGQVILLDFGLAKGTTGQMSKVAGRSIFGYTPHYAPLEQIQGTGTNERSDLYSLAATCYHLMTNVKPPDALARATSVLGGRPDPLQLASEINLEIPVTVAGVLHRTMDLNPVARPATAATMRRLLQDASGGTQESLLDPPTVKRSVVRQTNRAVKNPVLPPTIPSVEPRAEESLRTIASHPLPLRGPKETVIPKPDAVLPKKSYRSWIVSSVIALAVIGFIVGVGYFIPPNSIPVFKLLIGLPHYVCWVWVLVKQFQNRGAVHGTIGIVTCGIWTLIWGWINVSKLAIGNLMLIWTASIISQVIVEIVFAGPQYFEHVTP